MSLAISGKPSFLTNGKTAALNGANTAGNLKTVRVVLLSNVSSTNEFENTAKNIRSKPIEVSNTYGT